MIMNRGSDARTHRGVLSELNRLLVRGDALDPELAGDFARIQAERLKADYEPGLRIQEEDAHWAVERASLFVEQAAALLSSKRG